MKAYISGPMSGIPEFNFPRFADVTSAVRAMGLTAISPAEQDLEVIPNMRELDGFAGGDVERFAQSSGFQYEEALSRDTVAVAECDYIVMLPAWESSTGARHERYVAEACGKEVWIAFATFLKDGVETGWRLTKDPEQKRMNCVLMSRLGGVPARAA